MKKIKINNKLMLLPLSAFVLAACGSDSDSEYRGDSGGGGSTVISQASVIKPKAFEDGNPVLDLSEDTITLRFSLKENKNNNFYIYTESGNANIRNIEFELDYKEGLNEYIENYETFKSQVSGLGARLMNEDEAQIQISINDLPADMYQNIDDMDEGRMISDILKLKMTVDNGTKKIENINLNYINENSTPSLPRFFNSSFEFVQNSSNYIVVPISDSNVNDNLTYSIKTSSMPEFISFHTEQSCESKNDYELINCVIPKGDEREAVIRIESGYVSSKYEVENFIFTYTDQSAEIDEGGVTKNSFEEEFEITILNEDGDLTPTIVFSNNTYEINETTGGYISYQVNPANDRPDANLSVDYSINLDGLSITSEQDLENNRIEFSNINISENVERVLTVSVTDGEYSSYSEVLVRFVDNINRSPTISAPSNLSILESEGGYVSYTANLNNPNGDLTVSGSLSMSGGSVEVEHVQGENRFVFSDIQISESEVGIFTITASAGAETAKAEVLINFENNVYPVINFPSSISIMESEENLTIFPYIIRIENNTQNRDLNYDFKLSTPNGVVFGIDSNLSELSFDTTGLYTRQDITRTMTITATDGVTEIEQEVDVVFVNDIDKEMRDFLDEYQPIRQNASQLLSVDAEYHILDFFSEVARIKGVPARFVNEKVEYGKEILDYERNAIEDLMSKINEFVDNTEIDTPNPDFSEAYQNKELLSNEIGIYGAFVVSDVINVLASESDLPQLTDSKNQIGLTGVFGRYIGYGNYGTVIAGNRFEPKSGYKFLELVDPNKNVCD